MNEPKYQIGDRIGSWRIAHSYFASWLDTWVYGLELNGGTRKLTCTENTIDSIK